MSDTEVIEADLPQPIIQVRDAAKRELVMRVMPWGQTIETVHGPETFTRGAFDGTDPAAVTLWGMEHEVSLGIGQDGKPKMVRHPVGRGTEYFDAEDGGYLVARVAKTARGDEVLALAEDGIVSGVSVEFSEVPGGTETRQVRGRRARTHNRARLTGVSTTTKPGYDAAVIAVRTERDIEVPEGTQTTAEAQGPDMAALFGGLGDRIDGAIAAVQARSALPDEAVSKLLDRLEALEEQARSSFSFPRQDAKPYPDDFHRGDWMHLVLRSLSGEIIRSDEMEARVAAELVTADNLGVVPPAYSREMIGIIDPARPFLASTRQLPLPANGVSLIVPKITTRPTVGVQAAEKDELTSTASAITTETFNVKTVGGYGDISLQLLKRSDPSFLELYFDLLGEAYAVKADDLAVDALLAVTAVNEGGEIVPDEGAQFGSAWANAAAVSRLLVPDTLWLSSAAVGAFIDAKSDTTNAPLYANLAASFTAAGGTGGTISGLRPVHVPALDDESVDMIVGPSRGFGWAEDGTYQLQVDVPAQAGREVGLVGMLWFAPLYPAAFTTYTLGS